MFSKVETWRIYFCVKTKQDAYSLWLDASCEVTKDNLLVGLVQAPHFETPDWRIWTCRGCSWATVISFSPSFSVLARSRFQPSNVTINLVRTVPSTVGKKRTHTQIYIYIYKLHIYACGVHTLVVYYLLDIINPNAMPTSSQDCEAHWLWIGHTVLWIPPSRSIHWDCRCPNVAAWYLQFIVS